MRKKEFAHYNQQGKDEFSIKDSAPSGRDSLEIQSLILDANTRDDFELLQQQQQQQSINSSQDTDSNNSTLAHLAGLQQQPQTLLEINGLKLDQIINSKDLLRHSLTLSIILTIAYTLVFLIGLLGNSFVVIIVCKSPRMRTVTNYFIANLALADILVLLFCLPATLVSNLFVRKYQLLYKQNQFSQRTEQNNRNQFKR